VFPAWVSKNLKIKHQGSYGKLASWDDQGENDHFSSMSLVQKPLVDSKKYMFFL
jgi:hypothetical protein